MRVARRVGGTGDSERIDRQSVTGGTGGTGETGDARGKRKPVHTSPCVRILKERLLGLRRCVLIRAPGGCHFGEIQQRSSLGVNSPGATGRIDSVPSTEQIAAPAVQLMSRNAETDLSPGSGYFSSKSESYASICGPGRQESSS
jgi:hypothetical protein